MFAVCATGHIVVGGSQRVRVEVDRRDPIDVFIDELVSQLELDPPNARVASVDVYDKDFGEYVRLQNLRDVPDKIKVRLNVAEPKPAAAASSGAAAAGLSPATFAFLEQCNQRLVEAITVLAPAAAADAQRLLSANLRAQRQVLSGEVTPSEALASLDTTTESVTARRRVQTGTYKPSAEATAAVTGKPAPASAAPAADDFGDDMPAAARPKKSAARRIVDGLSPSRLERAARPTSAKASPARCHTSPKTRLCADPNITLFCVYNGAMSQRAKAIRADRHHPDYIAILRTLKQKFRSELALGYIDDTTGDFVEIHNAEELTQVIARVGADADTMTLQCWRAGGLGDDPNDVIAVPPLAGGVSPTNSAGLHSVVSVTPRPRSAAGHASLGPGQKMDVSNAYYSDEQLTDLFQQLDKDGSGYLDVEEFRAFFVSNYDDMGITDVDKKFNKLLASTTAFDDGKMDYDEFAVVMLKLSQW